jgi:hypothetical protein
MALIERQRRAAAICGIVIQLGWLMWIFGAQLDLGDAAAFGISVAMCGLAAGLVHLAGGAERQKAYAITILKSGLTWTLLWGLIGLIAGVAMDAPLFETAGVVMGPLAGAAFGCLLALSSRTEPKGVPELLILGTIAGTLLGLAGILDGLLDQGTFENWQGFLIVFAFLGAMGGLTSAVVVAARRISLTS